MKRSVYETIREKRQWHSPPDSTASQAGFRGWYSRGYLPHFDRQGACQMLNYRLADAMPVSRRQEWAGFLEIRDYARRRVQIEAYLDCGFGNCELRDACAAAIVEENWRRCDGQRYRLLAWVVMPNHVHVAVEIWQTPQTELIRDWKGYSARRINRLLGRTGQLWQEDYWDRYLRDEEHYRKVVHYIEWNPVKAGLVQTPEHWPFSSARFRDEYNQLQPPP